MSLIACAFAPTPGAGSEADITSGPASGFRFTLRDDGETTTGTGLDDLVRVLDGRTPDSLYLLVPAEAVLATRVQVPARSRRQLERALPYVVEEFLSQDVEQLHLAHGPRSAQGRIPVRVLTPDLMRDWLGALETAGLLPDSARLDADILPEPDDDRGIRVWVDAHRALIRTADAALAVDRPDLLMHLLALVRERNKEEPDETSPGTDDEPLVIRVAAPAGDQGAMDLAELEPALAGDGRVRVDLEPLASDLDTTLTEELARGCTGPELLTGPFQVEGRHRVTPWNRWRLAAGLAAAWFIVEVGLDAGRTSWLQARTETLRAQSTAAFREVFPDRTRIPDPRRELEALIGAGGGTGGSFMQLLGAFSARVGEADSEIRLRSLNWNARRGDLAIDLSAPGIAAVDRLKAALEADGHPVTIDSAVQEARGVRARVRLGSGGEA